MSRVSFQPDEERLIDDIESLKIYCDPMRIRIMQAMVRQPRTVNQIADELGVPFTRLYYHINLLEKHQLIRLVDTQAFSGAVEEKYYQVSAYNFVVDRNLLTFSESNPQNDGLNALLETIWDSTRADIRHSAESGLIDMPHTPPEPQTLFLRRGFFRLPPDQARQFYERLMALFQEFDQVESDKDDPFYGVTIAVYPTALPYQESDSEG